MPRNGPGIFPANFWPGFELDKSFVGHLMGRALGEYHIASSEHSADIVVSSIFASSLPAYPNKTICFVWENVRPNFSFARFFVSSDFDDYGGRNVRCPYWYSQLKWPGFDADPSLDTQRNHGYEPLVPPDQIARARPDAPVASRDRFCCFVAGNPELHRLNAVEALRAIDTVDCFGNIWGNALKSSKLDLLPGYRFNLCFENSMFPGYYTEKILHSWAAGCVPLYFADRFADHDFNPAAFINRAAFPALRDFVDHVRKINSSPDAMTDIASQPLVLREPSLEPAIEFIRKACENLR
ncbi:MAG: hypothetical protein K2Y29_00950 [Beijerinckiaceae bacterium]|nr:hypothetical protein [Beijerinckiaceae bacterium]